MAHRAATPTANVPPLVLFDGTCGMCNRLVQWLLDRDLNGTLHYAPLQADWVQAELQRRHIPVDLDSMVFLDGQRTHIRSEAARQVGLRLPGWPRVVARLGGIFPAFLRDPIYRLIAASRRRLSRTLGLDSCRILAPAQRQLIHDGPGPPPWLTQTTTPTTVQTSPKTAPTISRQAPTHP